MLMPACAHLGPTPAAAQVVLLQARTPQDCQDLGSVIGEAQGSLGYGDTLTQAAHDDLRAQAAAAGATHVVLTEDYPTAHEARAFGQAYRCAVGANLR